MATYSLNKGGQVVKRKVADVPKHQQGLEVVFLHLFSCSLHEVDGLRAHGVERD